MTHRMIPSTPNARSRHRPSPRRAPFRVTPRRAAPAMRASAASTAPPSAHARARPPARGIRTSARGVSKSPGAIVNDATRAIDILQLAWAIALPSDDPSVPRSRASTGTARRRTCAMALRRLAKLLVGVERAREREAIVNDAAFGRVVEGALCDADEESCGDDDARATALEETARALGSLAPFELTANARGYLERASRTTTMPAKCASVVSWALARCGLETPSEVENALRGTPFRFCPKMSAGLIDLDELRREVGFRREKLTTRDGRRVDERRETCWMGEAHVGSYAYSGKIMEPVPMVPCVARVRDALEAKMGERFDCCLINLYPNETAACAWHTDPLMGTRYATDSVIVSIGETRRFSFRPIGSTDAEAHWVRAIDGDCIWMFANCQDEYEHCVMTSEGEENSAPRASIVFKRSLKRRAAAPRKKKPSTVDDRGGRERRSDGGRGRGGRGRGGRGRGRS